MKNWREEFTWTGCIAPTLLGFAPSAFDIVTDYRFGGMLKEKGEILYEGLVYYFICQPVVILLLTSIYRKIVDVTPSVGSHCGAVGACIKGFCYTIIKLLAVLLVLAASYGIYKTAENFPHVFYYLAMPCSAFLLGVKMLTIVVQQNEMKKLSTQMTAQEGTYEASFQLLLIFTQVIYSSKVPDDDKFGIVFPAFCSIFTIIKASVENLCTFGETDLLQNASFLRKIGILVRFGPVFVLTMVFRLAGISYLMLGLHSCFEFAKEHDGITEWSEADGRMLLSFLVALPLLVVPIFFLFLANVWRNIATLAEILQGVLGELTSISVMHGVGRERSRGLQLAFAIYYLVIYTPILLMFAHIFGKVKNDSGTNPFLLVALVPLCCGWLAFPFFIIQIYYFKKRCCVSE
jgi:hypothetical protein